MRWVRREPMAVPVLTCRWRCPSGSLAWASKPAETMMRSGAKTRSAGNSVDCEGSALGLVRTKATSPTIASLPPPRARFECRDYPAN